MNEPHQVTDEFIREVHAREALARIDRELSELPEPLTQAQYVARRQTLVANEDRAALAELDRQCTGARRTRASLQKLRQERQRTLDALLGKHSGPHQQGERTGVGVIRSVPVAQVPVPAPAKPFVEPAILALREAAANAKHHHPLERIAQQETQGEGERLMVQAAERRNHERRARAR